MNLKNSGLTFQLAQTVTYSLRPYALTWRQGTGEGEGDVLLEIALSFEHAWV